MVELQNGTFPQTFHQRIPCRQKAQRGSNNCDRPRCPCCSDIWVPTLQGKYEDAEPLYRHAMEITETSFGKSHPQYSIRLNNLAQLLCKQVRAAVSCCTPGAYLACIDVLPACYSIRTAIKKVTGTSFLLSAIRSISLTGLASYDTD